MSFNLGNWADRLRCDSCTGDEPIDLDVPDDFFDNDFPDDFWDDPPDAPDDSFDLPDYYPTLEFTDGGFIFGVHGEF